MAFEQRVQQDRERFQLLMKRLSDTEWSQAAMSDAQSRLTTCHRQLRLTRLKINASHAAADKEHERFVAIKKHGLKHAWCKVRGTLYRSLNEQAKAWMREFKKYQEEEQRLIALKEEICAARNHLQQCHDSYEQYTKTERELTDLLDHVFAVANPSYAYENSLKDELSKKHEHLVALHSNVRALRHVLHLLTKARRAVVFTQRILDDVVLMETSDLFAHCVFGHVVVKSYVSKAKDTSIQAQQLLTDAKRTYSSIPSVDGLNLQKSYSIFNLDWDSISFDSNTAKYITDVNAALTRTLSHVKEQTERCEAERSQTSRDIQRLATVHFILRSAIVQNMIEASTIRLSSV